MVVLMVWPDLQLTSRTAAMTAAFIPFGILAWGTATLLLLMAAGRRSLTAALVTAAFLVLQVSWTLPAWPHASPAATGVPLRVLSANLLFGRAEGASLAAAIHAADPDVIVLTEYGLKVDRELGPTDLRQAYPFRVGTTALDYAAAGFWDASGTQVWSKTPLAALATAAGPFTQLAVRVERPGGPVTVVAAHPRNMLQGTPLWAQDAAALADLVRPHLDDAVVVAGDLNATRDHVTFRRLTSLGLTDAAEESGAGWLPTFPADRRRIPPLIAIDHVLVNDRVVAQGVRTARVSGTDHLAIVADLVVTP